MLWVKVFDETIDHPKTRKLAHLLGVGRHEALGVLVSLWLWGLRNANRDGVIQNASDSEIAEGIMYFDDVRRTSIRLSEKTTADSQTTVPLVEALIRSGWIDFQDGFLTLHDWDEHQEEFYKSHDTRERDKLRKREERKNLVCPADSTRTVQHIRTRTR